MKAGMTVLMLMVIACAAAQIDDRTVICPFGTSASFPGGEKAMQCFMIKNINYPDKAVRDSIEGTVYARFFIDSNGNVTNAVIIRGIGGGCDEEVLRVLNMMPTWTPGEFNNRKVATGFMWPIKFVLPNDSDTVSNNPDCEEHKETSFSITNATAASVQFSNSTPSLLPAYNCDTSEVYTFVDSMPEFPGGQKALGKFLAENLQWPTQDDIVGTVYVRFAIWCDGSVRDPIVLRGFHGLYDQEALRVVNMLPRWKPGTINGVPVAVYFTLPVKWTIAD